MKECTVISREELTNLVEKFSLVYDVVRIVEPKSTSVVCLGKEGYQRTQLEPCFSVWEKDERCENCISLRSCAEKKRMTKFEFRGEEAYCVVSMPFCVKDKEIEYLFSLELVNKVSDDMVLQAKGTGLIANQVKKLNKKIYEDSLTGVLNRRYYDEHLHIYEMAHTLPKKLAYLVLDVNHFKYVNDTFGHAKGDELLVDVAEVLKKNIRQTDKVIRIGGDEFLIVLRDCNELFAKKKVLQLKKEVSGLNKEWMEDYVPSASIGMSYSDKFEGSLNELEELFTKADERMYQDKSVVTNEKKKMLLVDDILINRKLLKNFFEKDFDIEEAEDGEQALKILISNPIEIVITDIYMPNMDGLTLVRKIRKNPEIENIIIFVITDRGEQHELEALDAGADDFINKPFNLDLLNHRIKGVLAQNTVFNRISQYQLSFNQNQIAFATVKVENGTVIYEYVNDAFVQMMSGSPAEFISGRKNLHFDGLTEFLIRVSTTRKREKITVYDRNTDNYYDFVAYAQDKDFCSFIVLKNESMKLVKQTQKHAEMEFLNLATVNPETFGALFINLISETCEKGFGRSKYLKEFDFPMDYQLMLEELSGFTATDEAKKQFMEFTQANHLLQMYQEGKHNLGIELAFRLLSGNVHWLGIYVKLSQNPLTKDIEAILYSIDIHERKMSQLVIDTVSRKNFDTLFCIDVQADTAQVYLGDGTVYWSEPFPVSKIDAEIVKYLDSYYKEPDKEQFIKDNYISVIAKKMQSMERYTVSYILTGEDGEKQLKKGTYYWLDSSKTLLCFTREDITEVVKKEQEVNRRLQSVNEELIKASNAKLEFLSRMSHDIRTPMNTIIGLSVLALDDIRSPDKMLEYIKQINSAGEFLLGLVNDILDMDKINHGQMKLNKEPYGYEEFLDSMKMMFESSCKQKGLTLIFEQKKKNYRIMTDKIRLNQIFFNILSNSVKYTPVGGTITYYTENLVKNGNIITCDYIIQDTGIGMSEKFQKQLFQVFVQEGKNINSQGSGLGLAITKSLVDLMKGTITINSSEGKGTTVKIHLSFELADEQTDAYLEEKKQSSLLSAHYLSGKNVLIVEDHQVNQGILKQLLEKKGILVSCANDGKEAIEKFKASSIDYFQAILMDIRMPVMDGLEATKKIRSLNRIDAAKIPIIAMTANAYDEDIIATKKAGMNAHLSKPINVNRLYQTLQHYF